LDDVTFEVKRGDVHCLLGENGAGKSTLIKILTGAQQRTQGTILMNGKPFEARDTAHARMLGVSAVFQELNVVDQLTVEENLMLGQEPTRFGFPLKNDNLAKVVEALRRMEPSIDPKQPVSKLSAAKKQIMEIIKATETSAEILILDEPTASLCENETQRLFHIIRELKKQNVTILYISHRIEEIFQIGDYVTVLRDGRHVDTKPLSEIKNKEELIHMIIGKTVAERYRPRETAFNDFAIEAQGVSNRRLHNVSFKIRKGEIAGFYGLIGSGKTEIARALYGIDAYEGDMLIHGNAAKFRSPTDAVKGGVSLVPEERRTEGLFTSLSIRKNVISMNMERIATIGILNRGKEKEVSAGYVRKLSIATDTDEKKASLLSGGNQQKVVLAKCLNSDANIFLFDEPTRGVDVGAKDEIHKIIRGLADEGNTCLVFTSELPEALSCCDRIFLLRDGTLLDVIENGPGVEAGQIISIVAGGES
jgi:ribose transport system ATP-binding protein